MEIIYHGSPDKFDTALPKHNKRFNKNGEKIWDMESFHGTPYKWIALVYTRTRRDNYTTGVDLYKEKKIVNIYGPKDLDDALDHLYGKGGYLYEFEAKDFLHEEGLGKLERYTSSALTPIRVSRIDDPVTLMKELGVEFKFTPFSEL